MNDMVYAESYGRAFRSWQIGISRHITNIFKDEEQQQDTTVAKIATAVNRGIRGKVEEPVNFYNLDMVAEIIHTKAGKTKEHMGLTTWKNAPDGRILKSDVSIAKNYLMWNTVLKNKYQFLRI